jgi:hypothetical protein
MKCKQLRILESINIAKILNDYFPEQNVEVDIGFRKWDRVQIIIDTVV